jgi:transcriptional regulator with XRE-family HTH domain
MLSNEVIMMYKETFPQRLKKARQNTGFSQREVARETNISQPSIAQYETGTREPDIETLGKLAEFYGVSIDWLFGIGGKTNYDLDGVSRSNNIPPEMRL